MRNKKKMPVFLKKKVIQQQPQLEFYLNYMAPSYFLCKNSFMFNKFFRKFFSFHFFFFKKLWFFAKTLAAGKIFYRFVMLEQKKHIFGNCFKFNTSYSVSKHDDFFFFFKKRKIHVLNNVFFKTAHFSKGFSSNFFFITAANLINLPESYDNLENFFYKGEIYANFLNPLWDENLISFLDNFSFDFAIQYNFFFILEIYKIHVIITLKNSLIILYSYLKRKAHRLDFVTNIFYQPFY